MDTVDDNGVERKKHTHLIPRLKSKKNGHCSAHPPHAPVS